MRFDFIKCHGSGNDFPLIDRRGIDLGDAEWSRVAIALADRRGTVGGDGILLLGDGDDHSDFGMAMFNSDGSAAETCLNGLRCVARAGFAATGLDRATVKLKTSYATVACAADLLPGVYTVRETAGPADRDVTRWPMRVRGAWVTDEPIAQLHSDRRFVAVGMPNPHLVSFVEHVDAAELTRVGRLGEAAQPWLPNRANVSFVRKLGPAELYVRTWERGIGLTDSCGSAMAASLYAAGLTLRLPFGRETMVRNRGGMVFAAAAADGMVTISGNATFDHAGSVEVDLDAATAGPVTVTERFEAETAAWRAVLLELERPAATPPWAGHGAAPAAT